MHEASLMNGLLNTARKTALENGAIKVNGVTVSVGKLSNVMPDALSFAFSAMTREGLLKGAKLIIKEVAPAARCEDCAFEYEPIDFPFVCPRCGCVFFKITRGEDTVLESIDCEIQ